MTTARIITGDVREVLSTLPDESVQCVVTSPPYWGLRDYGVDGQMGLEQSPTEYVAGMVAVFREVWRVLRPDGTLWLNLGDSYAAAPVGTFNGGGFKDTSAKNGTRDLSGVAQSGRMDKVKASGLKPKDLVGIPWRVAFALQDDGWFLRADIIWHKPNPMPESVRDRPTKAHEYLFLLTKSARYFYDADAIRETARADPRGPGLHNGYSPPGQSPHRGGMRPGVKHATDKQRGHGRRHDGFNDRWDAMTREEQQVLSANKRSVWTIATHPYSEAHFATFPLDLVLPCILAGSSERGCCPECGAPWRRVVEREREYDHVTTRNGKSKDGPYAGQTGSGIGTHDVRHGVRSLTTTTGWEPTCTHDAEPVPCTVLDPFSGAGTVGVVALRHGRNYIGVELNSEYVEMSRRRIHGDAPLMNVVEVA